ncbi:MAG: hypothetical protein H6715_04115 [Myxococcales bacterium]|nr:hypothetical protein [Myxococcales bacterium]MCB9708611.1 hypothetical protein [Myxococcales bacterium]
MRLWTRFLIVTAVLLLTYQAHARTGSAIEYRYDQVWSATIRLVRVDLRMAIDEQDKDLGFVLFQYREGKREFPGSIEVIEEKDDGGKRTIQAVVQIPGMPSYVEQVMLNQLKKKLKDDYGPPLPPPSKKKDDGKQGGREKADSDRFDSDRKGPTMRERDAGRSKVRGNERRESGSDSPSR